MDKLAYFYPTPKMIHLAHLEIPIFIIEIKILTLTKEIDNAIDNR